jgi:Tfp pilus assembly protein FimT
MVIALALAALLAGFVTPSGWTKSASARAHDDGFVGRLVAQGE